MKPRTFSRTSESGTPATFPPFRIGSSWPDEMRNSDPAIPERLHLTTPGRHGAVRQFARFLVVGLANTAISFVVYRALLLVGTHYVVAAPLAFMAGAVNGYVFNRRWTFAASDSRRARMLYFAIAAVAAAATSVLVLLFVLGAGLDKVEAYLVAIPPVTLATFSANRRWTFAERAAASGVCARVPSARA